MPSRTALALAVGLIVGCNDSIDALYAAGKDVPASMGTTTVTSGPGESTGAAASGASVSGETSDSADATSLGSTSSSATSGEDTTGAAPLPPPSILTVELPDKVTTAGPMQVRVYAQHAATADVRLDEGLPLDLMNEGDLDGDGVDVFSGVVPIHGSHDNGPHALTATVRRAGLEDSLARPFAVATPPAGSLAWEKYGGAGTRTARLAATPEGPVYEAGSLELDGLARPALRLRDPMTGNDVWQEGARVLDAREGAIADVALAPDGRVWVAMNVREGNTWIARIAAFTADAQPTDAELEKPGTTVQAIDTDSAGGCFAVGFAVTPFGDSDVLVWRMTSTGVPILSGHPWDYLSAVPVPHSFDDLAFDVVIDELTDEAWIVGGSMGKHNINEGAKEARGLILHVDVDTFEFLSPAFVAPPAGDVNQSMFHAAWLEPENLLVTGYQCDMMCLAQSVLATRYTFAGAPTWGYAGTPTKAAAGYGIASDSHGTILIAASIKDNTTTHAVLLGRAGADPAFAPVAFPGKDTSLASDVVVGPYDWPFAAGNVTMNGALQGYVMHTHP